VGAAKLFETGFDVMAAATQARGQGCTLLLLPAYSPDLDPIESASSKLKRLLRTAAARTVEALWDAIGKLLDRFRPEECRNYIRHAGYPAT
jgi:transposase